MLVYKSALEGFSYKDVIQVLVMVIRSSHRSNWLTVIMKLTGKISNPAKYFTQVSSQMTAQEPSSKLLLTIPSLPVSLKSCHKLGNLILV
jgi:hypothetical protein